MSYEELSKKRTKALANSLYQTYDEVCFKVFGKHISELNEAEKFCLNEGIKGGTRGLHKF